MAPEPKKLAVAEDIESGPSVRFLREFARRHGVAVVGGSIPLRVNDPDKVANGCLVVGPSGEVVARYDKMHMFDVAVDERDTHVESDFIEPGREVVTADVLGVTIGLTICYDLRFPELYRALAVRGARVIFVPSAFTVPTGRDHWKVLLRARAIENGCYVVAVGQVGHHYGERYTYGHSMVVDPWGKVVGELGGDEPGILCCDLDFDLVNETRRRIPSLSHVREELIGRLHDKRKA
jgi:predicted amidohydrolase